MIDLFVVFLFFVIFGIIHLVSYILYNIYVMCFVGLLKCLHCLPCVDRIEWQKRKVNSIIELKIDDDNFCSICYEDYLSDKVILQLNCEHIFHMECLNEWWKRINEKKCPYCKVINNNLVIVKNISNINVN